MTAIGFESSDDSDENEIKNTTKLKPHQITIKTNPTQNIQPTQYSFHNQLISNPNKRRKLSSITKLQSFALENNPRNINIEEVEPSQYEWAEHPKIAIISALVDFAPKIKRFRLKMIANILPNTEYIPEEFVAVRVRLKYPRIMVTIFPNGRLTAQSGKSCIACKIALRKIAKKLKDMCGYTDIQWQSSKLSYYGIHANARFMFNINLKEFAKNDVCTDYMEDEQSFYLKYIHPKYNGICKIYHQGRIIVMGAQSVEKSNQWLNDMFEKCQPYFTTSVVDELKDNYVVGNHFANRNRMKGDLYSDDDSMMYGGENLFPTMHMMSYDDDNDYLVNENAEYVGPPPLI